MLRVCADIWWDFRRHEVWDSKQESVWILYTPVAREPFSNFICNEEKTYLEAFLVTIFKQVHEGLAFLHLQGWVHRDIKPANLGIVSFEPPRAVILDLGSAKKIKPGEFTIQPKAGSYGTISYLAPEIETEPYNQLVDIWSIGFVG